MIMDLRQERRRRGLSLEQVAQRSRIPVQYLRALETGHYTDVPQGPFLDGYQRQYREFLGATTLDAVTPRPNLEVDPALAPDLAPDL
ncbi:MAG: helix-turn-helix domain-containing protein, partial [Oligoflexia bacterium]|nr:helix-turn-helix domain-containing protein [Oligoflexia bacterium]